MLYYCFSALQPALPGVIILRAMVFLPQTEGQTQNNCGLKKNETVND